jgi:hypothetical protein
MTSDERNHDGGAGGDGDSGAGESSGDARDGARLRQRSEAYLDGLFGAGAGRRHGAFLERLESAPLRDTLHRYHLLEAGTAHLSVEENYLLGLAVLCALRSFGPAAMFAKTLRHLGTPRARILEVVTRLSMWIGGVPAAEAAAHVQKALREYEERGLASLDAWFPPPPRDAVPEDDG